LVVCGDECIDVLLQFLEAVKEAPSVTDPSIIFIQHVCENQWVTSLG
jgi:hypothetical protein